MSHECPECDHLCYCDMDDTPLPAPNDCRHGCEPEYEEWDMGDAEFDEEAARGE